MKKILLLLLTSFALFSVLTCTKKAKEQPVIVFNNGDTIVSVDEGIKQEVLVNINAPGQLEEVSFFYMPLTDTVKNPIGESVVNFPKPKRYSSKVLVEGKSEDYFFVVKAKDKNNKTAFANLLVKTSSHIPVDNVSENDNLKKESKSIVTTTKFKDLNTTFTSTSSVPSIPSNKKGQFIAGFNKNTLGSSLSIGNLKNNNAIQKLVDAQKNQNQIDLMFFYGKENGVTITSPGHDLAKKVFNNQQYGTQTWSTKRITYLSKFQSTIPFEKITMQDAENTFNNDESEKIVLNHLKENDIIFFQTENETLGVIRIKYIGENNQSVISFDVKLFAEGDEMSSTAMEEEVNVPNDNATTGDVYDEDASYDEEGMEIIEEGEEEEDMIEEEQIEVTGGASLDGSSLKFDEISFHLQPVSNIYSLGVNNLVG